MASPKLEAFQVYNISTGAPLTGAAGGMSFAAYKDSTGANLVAPAITEIGGGWYGFVPTLPVDPNKGLVYTVATGAAPTYVGRYVRPEDYTTDDIPTIKSDLALLKKVGVNRWQIHTTGPDANRLVIYDDDGTTPLYKFSLADSNGAPTTSAPYRRTPV